MENADDLACLGDGATWIWNSFSLHYPDAVQILDYYHATEHLDDVAKAWYGEDPAKAKCWLETRELDLLSDCVEDVIRSIWSWHPIDEKAREIRRVELGYFEKNKDRMLYASLKANGYHIGSGLVESACKMIVTQRLKQSGMRWSEPGAKSIAPAFVPAQRPFSRHFTLCKGSMNLPSMCDAPTAISVLDNRMFGGYTKLEPEVVLSCKLQFK